MEKTNMTRLVPFFVILLSGITNSVATTEFSDWRKTKVIYDQGGRSTNNYVDGVAFEEPEVKQTLFPIETPELSVGRIEADEGANANLMAAVRPIFIIGYDQTSLQWLKSNKDWLVKKGAVGYIANVQNAKQVEHIFELVDKQIYMMPMNASELAKQLNIRHYPFYMDKDGVMR